MFATTLHAANCGLDEISVIAHCIVHNVLPDQFLGQILGTGACLLLSRDKKYQITKEPASQRVYMASKEHRQHINSLIGRFFRNLALFLAELSNKQAPSVKTRPEKRSKNANNH